MNADPTTSPADTVDAAAGADLLHRLIERQVDISPDAIAVVCRDAEISYAALDTWANRLAHRLIRAGAGPDRPVAVVAQRRIETVVSLLAVLKAGSAYVPVDPANPPRRFHHVVRDCGARLLVAAGDAPVPADGGAFTTVRCDADVPADDLDGEPTARPDAVVRPDNAAYVIYTSGSTGEPKGVVVPHRQIVAATHANRAYERPDPAAFLLLISFSFDACAVGLYWTLATGGTVVIPTPEELRDPCAVRALAARHRVTHLDCTPALYSLILGDDPGPLATLRCAIVGGEACPADLVERHHAALPGCQLFNNYGPTETTVWATTAALAPLPPDAPVPIGTAIPGVRTYVLDDDLQPVGSGELFIGGAGVARGYHGRPALTADRFLPDPQADGPGARMYRTGDRARTSADGTLEFLGRVDHQVKVRGFRIELGEVEQAIAAHHEVVETVVDVRSLGGTDTLVAWVGARPDSTLSSDAIRDHLAARLPDHMVPSHIAVVDGIPRNVAGKVDRAQLPDPVQPVATGADPATPLEVEVAELAEEVLGIGGIGRHTSFFDLGATSLHVSKLLLGTWSRFQVAIPIHQLFQVPTVAGLAQIIEAVRRTNDPNALETWTMEQLEEAARLAPDIVTDGLPHSEWSRPRDILLTGATGYLGAFLIKELVERTDATIRCLVRAGSPQEAFDRVCAAMKRYLIWDDALADRLEMVVGDLGKPRFGLTDATYAELAAHVDVIYHSGALVNFLFPYGEMKPPNVDGTAEVLRMATTTTVKAVHYISTIDMFLETDIDRPYLEDMEMVAEDVPEGYARSKWLAEAFVREARDRGVPCSIYRPGMMISHTETGATQLNDYLLIEIAGLLEFGVVPDVHYMFDATPIDFSAQAVAHISLKEGCLGGTYHLWNLHPVRVETIYDWIRSFGYSIDAVPFETVIQHLVTVDPSNPIFPLLPLFLDEEHRLMPDSFEPEVMAQTDLAAECRNTIAALEGSGIECPPMSEDLTHRCFQYLVDVGFFPEPAQQRAKVREQSAVSA
ncbi:non-ribosomal peptide synthetase family protein [Pseudonocardia sp. TRM90224]|uniref:non-ribosomal peptide synthetase family protein n=1 Tax=Pseudonocardia sp. TRM90224 TaxID=2812678 RepID=UPI001E3839D6|nr:amino acid adenylation domain-containing protein [Pseudonocardia sp. TRM90224]